MVTNLPNILTTIISIIRRVVVMAISEKGINPTSMTTYIRTIKNKEVSYSYISKYGSY